LAIRPKAALVEPETSVPFLLRRKR
jgi:hypothetical protein